MFDVNNNNYTVVYVCRSFQICGKNTNVMHPTVEALNNTHPRGTSKQALKQYLPNVS